MVDKHVNKYLMQFIYDSLELKYYKHKVVILVLYF
jgi:hypothetical protein